GILPGRIVHDLDQRRLARAPLFGVVVADAQVGVLVLRADRRVGIGNLLALDALRVEPRHQVGGAIGADDGDLERLFHLFLRLALAHPGKPDDQQRRQDRPHQQAEHQRLAVADEFPEFLLPDDGERLHACSPSSVPMSWTNASSRLSWPVCARSASALPSATTRPCAITTMRSQSAATSCMMWLEKITQRPSPRSWRRKSRSPRVVITSRPLVGSSRITLRGSCTNARAIAVLVRCPCEKPSVWRSRKSSICRASASTRVRSAITAGDIPCSSPK